MSGVSGSMPDVLALTVCWTFDLIPDKDQKVNQAISGHVNVLGFSTLVTFLHTTNIILILSKESSQRGVSTS